jgi:hypothetical protein
MTCPFASSTIEVASGAATRQPRMRRVQVSTTEANPDQVDT